MDWVDTNCAIPQIFYGRRKELMTQKLGGAFPCGQ